MINYLITSHGVSHVHSLEFPEVKLSNLISAQTLYSSAVQNCCLPSVRTNFNKDIYLKYF